MDNTRKQFSGVADLLGGRGQTAGGHGASEHEGIPGKKPGRLGNNLGSDLWVETRGRTCGCHALLPFTLPMTVNLGLATSPSRSWPQDLGNSPTVAIRENQQQARRNTPGFVMIAPPLGWSADSLFPRGRVGGCTAVQNYNQGMAPPSYYGQ